MQKRNSICEQKNIWGRLKNSNDIRDEFIADRWQTTDEFSVERAQRHPT